MEKRLRLRLTFRIVFKVTSEERGEQRAWERYMLFFPLSLSILHLLESSSRLWGGLLLLEEKALPSSSSS